MTCFHLRQATRLLPWLALSVVALACGGEGGADSSGEIVILDPGGNAGGACIQPPMPDDEPLLVTAPWFEEALTFPGADINAEVRVNAGRTERVIVDLINAWSTTSPPVQTLEFDQVSSSAIPLLFTFPDEDPFAGRYSLRITLCAGDCLEQAIVYDLVFEDRNILPKFYTRAKFERNEQVGALDTCLRLPSIVLQ
jgi:hypothetical protein